MKKEKKRLRFQRKLRSRSLNISCTRHARSVQNAVKLRDNTACNRRLRAVKVFRLVREKPREKRIEHVENDRGGRSETSIGDVHTL